MTARWLLAAVLLAAPAWAWPPDVIQDVELGKEKFVSMKTLEWFEVEDPKVVTVEYLESGELLLTPLKPGRTLVLMYAEKQFGVWRVRVGGKTQPEAGALPAALKACPKLEHHPDAYDKLVGPVSDEKCRQALLALLATDAFLGRELDLTFDKEVLQTQLKTILVGLAAARSKVSARYDGASLVLTGSADPAGQKKALWEVFRRSAGRVALDDQVEVSGESPTIVDGGLAPAKK